MKNINRKLQIGVMGSAADTKYSKEVERIAEKVGELLAEAGAVTVFGAEKDSDSLSTAACREAKRKSGLAVGVTYGKHKDVWEKDMADFIVASGLERGGGRETTLVLSCDAVIAISGGSGTLTELAIAYQADIPMVAIKTTGGWAERLADTYIDTRKRRKIIGVDTPEEAVKIALREAKEYIKKYG
ncbi:LOG family protein [Candidatus Amesbacteria bacterium]|nr:LOG family protein [Candidatus Amesbacteria bacterium]